MPLMTLGLAVYSSRKHETLPCTDRFPFRRGLLERGERRVNALGLRLGDQIEKHVSELGMVDA